MSGFSSYVWYISLKTHFTSEKYDILKSGTIPVTQAQYDKKGGVKYAMERLSRKNSQSDLCQYFIANFLAGDKYGGVFNADGQAIYLDWIKRKESLSYLYEQDLNTLLEMKVDRLPIILNNETFNPIAFLWMPLSGHPPILRAYLGKHVMLETLVILEQLYKYKARLDESLAYDPVWKETSKLLGKAIPFIDIEASTFRDITERIFPNVHHGVTTSE